MHAIHALIQPYIDNHSALGLAVALLQRGEISYLEGFGITSVEENGVKVTPRTLFAFGSICKNLCAVLVMRLVNQGLLELDMPIVHYLPDLRFNDVDFGSKVTLRHLLSHTSGLPLGGKYWGPRDPDSLRRFVYEQIPHYPFLSEPGVVHLYSNTVFCVAGHVAEAVTGKFYDDLVQEYLLEPLQMKHVTFDPVVAMTYPIALPHEIDSEGKPYVLHRMTYNVSGNPSSFALGSVSDLANLAQMCLNQGKCGEQEFLTASSVADMQRIHGNRHISAALHPLADNYLGYGLGFEIGQYRGQRAAGHGGMNLTYNCFFKLFPDQQAGVVVLTNQSKGGEVWKLVTSLYDYALGLPKPDNAGRSVPAPLSTPLDSGELSQYEGTFVRVELADLITFRVGKADSDADELVLDFRGRSLPLVPIADNTFYAQFSEKWEFPIVFVRNEAGAILHIMLGGEPYHPITLDPDFQPDIQLLKSYAGLYKDPSNMNREEMFTVRVEDGVLYFAEATNEVACKAISNRTFLSDMDMIEFLDGDSQGGKVLMWGKAMRYYPIDQELWKSKGVIQFLVDVAMLPQRVF